VPNIAVELLTGARESAARTGAHELEVEDALVLEDEHPVGNRKPTWDVALNPGAGEGSAKARLWDHPQAMLASELDEQMV
jgi:hypothetical protein